MVDKNIHKKEFRLRILCTNTCNIKCVYCLNDFQPKNQDAQFLSREYACDAIRSYLSVKNKHPVVTFSGGEPGMWYWLPYCAEYARRKGAHVKICTNGLALDSTLDKYVDNWHLHVLSPSSLPRWIKPSKVLIQYVICKETTLEEMCAIVEYYDDIPVKFFVDIYEPDKSALYDKIEVTQKKYGHKITTRFTGIQTNRGSICAGCTKDCVTLKGVWVFPDGSASTCPQGVLPIQTLYTTYKELEKFMASAAWGHNN